MRTLTLQADRQLLTKTGDFSGLVVGSKGYLRLQVNFDDSWAGYKRRAVFTLEDGGAIAEPLNNNSCTVPDAAAACMTFKVQIVGTYKDRTLNTNSVTIIQRRR